MRRFERSRYPRGHQEEVPSETVTNGLGENTSANSILRGCNLSVLCLADEPEILHLHSRRRGASPEKKQLGILQEVSKSMTCRQRWRTGPWQ